MSRASSYMRLLTAGGALALLVGCGFHLQKAENLPPQMTRTYIQAPTSVPFFLKQMRRLLQSDRTRVIDDPDQATATLLITQANPGQRVLSVNAKGHPREYELSLTVTFELHDKSGSVLLNSQSITMTRSYSFNENDILSAGRETAMLNQALQRDVAQQVVWRLEAIGKRGGDGTSAD